MQGVRIEWNDGRLMQPGEFALAPGDIWYACCPDGRLANLQRHTVIEHDDRTISVTPSIKVSGGGDDGSWHGYLTKGVWRECE